MSGTGGQRDGRDDLATVLSNRLMLESVRSDPLRSRPMRVLGSSQPAVECTSGEGLPRCKSLPCITTVSVNVKPKRLLLKTFHSRRNSDG